MKLEVRNIWNDLEYRFDGKLVPTQNIKAVQVKWPDGTLRWHEVGVQTEDGTTYDYGRACRYRTLRAYLFEKVHGLEVPIELTGKNFHIVEYQERHEVTQEVVNSNIPWRQNGETK